MKRDRILYKAHLSYLLRQLRKDADLIAPLRSSQGDITFSSIDNIHQVELDCPASIPSPKEFLFPQKEEMFRFSAGSVENTADTRKRVVFGVRSCDISAVLLLDKFYGGLNEDDYYMSRRKNTLFISIGCNSPDPGCFCMGLGTGPFLKAGFDIQLTDLGDRYLVETGSKEGRRVVEDHGHLFSMPRKTDYDDQYEAVLSAQSGFEKRITLESARRKILEEKVNDKFWESVASRCLECGGCVYLCPLCTCFNVVDWKTGESKGSRFRIWDTCMFKGFTRMAGNVWPAEKKVLRIKRWYFHKLLYYPEQLGNFGCVGCGRCAQTCPGRIDMASTARKIERL